MLPLPGQRLQQQGCVLLHIGLLVVKDCQQLGDGGVEAVGAFAGIDPVNLAQGSRHVLEVVVPALGLILLPVGQGAGWVTRLPGGVVNSLDVQHWNNSLVVLQRQR